jgi:hypothetical protein
MVFVDELQEYPTNPFGYTWWAHLWTDGELSELHAFAKSIGLKRTWFQDDDFLPHYDIAGQRKHRTARNKGAVVSTIYGHYRRQKTEHQEEVTDG